jgi:hypothetical protein
MMIQLLLPFCTKPTEEEELHGVYQQDSVTFHMTHANLEALWEVYSDCVISHGL